MVTKTLDEHIEITPGIKGGRPRIAGHRITVQNIVIWHEWLGHTVDEIASDYNLSIADVYAAFAYYHDHREEIDKDIKDDEEFVEAFKKEFPSKEGRNFMAIKFYCAFIKQGLLTMELFIHIKAHL
jgi:uncharacterized protein (DUF433 family)